MNDFIQVEFEFLSNEQKEILIALLAEKDYDGFQEEGDVLIAYIPKEKFDEAILKIISEQNGMTYKFHEVVERNWNREWESNFQPVVINDFVAIRADFHQPVRDTQHEIIITPKMSFGTGHHPTTSMMIEMMRDVDFVNNCVLDFGTGTAILAILAEKLGSGEIIAIDNDEWSIANAKENIEKNKCEKIKLQKKDSAGGKNNYDVILANIIKTVILLNFDEFVKQLVPNGVILISGLLKEDEFEIRDIAEENSLFIRKRLEKEGWICLLLQ